MLATCVCTCACETALGCTTQIVQSDSRVQCLAYKTNASSSTMSLPLEVSMLLIPDPLIYH